MMAHSATYRSLLLLCVVGSLICSSSAQTCRSQNFANNKVFQTCLDLPVLNAFLHWTYFPSNSTVDIAYRATPAAAGGWVAWAINPTGTGMVGSQAIVGYVDSGSVKVITTSIDSFGPSMQNGSISFPVANLAGVSSGNDIILFATLTFNGSTVNQVWQTGPRSGSTLSAHAMSTPNTQSKGTLNLLSGQSTSTSGGNSSNRTAQICKSQNFANNKVFQTCLDLPVLNAFLHWTYLPSTGTVDIAYRATPAAAGGWVAWAVNPTGTGMVGSQAIVGYVDSGSVKVITTSIDSFRPSMQNGSISFPVANLAGMSSGNDIILFATLTLSGSTVNQVWQTGPRSGSTLSSHSMSTANTQSKGTLNLLSGQSTSTSGGNSRTRRKNLHGVLNAVSWGILMPLGIIIARYMRVFKSADPAWFYLHVTCQCSAYILGVAGWGTGMKLGSESPGVKETFHRNVGITLFCLATLQVFALLLRPKKDHKYRIYWNVYHHSVGYSIIILGIINIFKGLNILQADNKWKRTYIGILISLAAVAVVLEVFTWIVVIRRRSRNSEKSHHGANGTNGYGVRSDV